MVSLRWLDRDGQSFALELFLVELGSLFVGCQEEGQAALVGFEGSHGRCFEVERGEGDDGLDDKLHVVLIVVVQKHLPRRKHLWGLAGGCRLT